MKQNGRQNREARAAARRLAHEVLVARNREIRRLYSEGKTLRQLAGAFGVSHTRIWCIVRDMEEVAA